MRIYIAGSGGMLGEAMHRVLSERHELQCSDIDLNEPWLGFCDFRDFNSYRASVEAFAPDILFHLGAHTDLEYCENNPADAYATNTLSVEHAATLANSHGIPLVYISTAGVFDGKQSSYDDWDVPNPLGVYARSKFMGERIVETRVRNSYICRAGWMMGGGIKKDKKFISKLVKQLLDGARVINVVDDRLGTPTYTVDFARNLEKLIESEYYGLYNMVCGGATGRFEVAKELIGILGLAATVEVNAVSSDFFSNEYFAPRPPSERLVNYKLNLRGLDHMRDWRVALREYIADYYAEQMEVFSDASSDA